MTKIIFGLFIFNLVLWILVGFAAVTEGELDLAFQHQILMQRGP
jgi:hypothetical protein